MPDKIEESVAEEAEKVTLRLAGRRCALSGRKRREKAFAKTASDFDKAEEEWLELEMLRETVGG